jgi:Holliday junction resolvasome RuvABC endonuclease subunit
MNGLIKVAGLDPSLTNFGMCIAYVDPQTYEVASVEKIGMVKTEPGKHKQQRKNSDDIVRADKIIKNVMKFLEGVNMVFAEVPVGSQNARAMCSYGICVAALAAIKQKYPLIQVMPVDLKVAVMGSKTASKDDIIDWATGLYPHLDWKTKNRKGELSRTKDNEHMADAIGSVHTGVESDDFIAAAAILETVTKAA